MKKHRILVMAHAHPDFSLGGGEIAAYNLFKAYKQAAEVEDAWYLGRADRGRGASGNISLRRPNEYLWEQAIGNWHLMKAAHQESVTTWFADLIRALKPTVVHTHHYAHLGLEYLRVIKQVDPAIRIVMTLHEYMAICKQNGQMVKNGSKRLCSRESPDDCHQCFPETTAEDFWLRKRYFMSHFELVDHFVSPSQFLKDRYVAWGLPKNRIDVIENGQSPEEPLPPRSLAPGETRNRFGFFGQINPFKGIDVILEALASMSETQLSKIHFEVHGANLEWQTADFQAKIEKLSAPLIYSGCLRWVGPYQPSEMKTRLAAIDWVVVPSIWWENSPMVIQESFSMGRPLIVSDIGGMAEKVRNSVDGIHVAANNRIDWASKIIECSQNNEVWEKCWSGIVMPVSYDNCARMHTHLFNWQL